MKDYLLVRAGVDVGEERWFSLKLSPEETPDADGMAQILYLPAFYGRGEKSGVGRKGFRAWRGRRRVEKQRKRAALQALKNREQAAAEIKKFLADIQKIVDCRYECRCAYADGVRRYLTAPSGEVKACLSTLWRQNWPFREFEEYLEPPWAQMLLEEAKPPHFVALGCAACTPGVIERCARRMKSLRWFLEEEACTREIQDFVEDFYEEYGLAAALHLLEGGRAFSRLLLETAEPVCILDFTQEPHIPAGGLARGSVWLDFCSTEEKARRLLEREDGISYFSVKEIWKRAGKP